uniref:Phytanoyl-CoA dioxygenase n=1 Tax=Ciona savignyi TaxID=51511 RepID=H2ZMW8_CIOSA
QLTPQQLDDYFKKGFLVVKDFFPPGRLDVVRSGIDKLVDDLANKLCNAGKIKNKHEDKDFFTRLYHLEKEFKGTAILLHKQGILPKEFQDLWSDEKLLNVVEQMVGPNVAGHPVWNLRTKTPHNEQTTVPWHQDNAYLEPCSLECLQVTAWIPMVDANMVNGCMQVASGGHKAGKTLKHTCCAGGTWYVEMEEKDLDQLGLDAKKDIVTCEVPYGSVLFLNNAIPHQSLENRSDIIRWSLDLRWHDPAKENGFYGLKKSVLMRKADDPDYKIDWDEFAGVDRTKIQMKNLKEDNDDFTTEVAGPWMKRWD